MKKAAVPSILVTVVLLALGVIAEAQQPGKMPKIGFLSSGPATRPWRAAFQREFEKLGYVDGKNITFIHRSADTNYDRLPALAEELVRLKVDVIITPGSNDTRAAKNATKTIPIVFLGAGSDPVVLGLVDSLARPGGNLTGISNMPLSWLANDWSYSRKPFRSSPGLRCCGIRRMRALRKFGRRANHKPRNLVCNFIPWR